MKRVLAILSLVASLGCFLPSASVAAEVKWGNVTPYKVKLFYPGVTDWDLLTSKDHGVGMNPVLKRKKGCQDCHVDKDGNLDIRADEIAKGTLSTKASKKPFEPKPDGRPGFLDATLQAAYDDENIYLRVQWSSAGKSWKGGDGDAPDRLSIQLNSSQEDFVKYGCFITCHPDQNSMPGSPSKDKVGKHPYYSGQKRDNVRLYAPYTRTEGGGWADMKSAKELEDLGKGGALIDLWQVEFKANGFDMVDGWILEDRQADNKDIDGSGNWDGGKYTFALKRKLKTADTKDVELKAGSPFTATIAIHDDKSKDRKHYVSYPLSIGLGADGIVRATKLK